MNIRWYYDSSRTTHLIKFVYISSIILKLHLALERLHIEFSLRVNQVDIFQSNIFIMQRMLKHTILPIQYLTIMSSPFDIISFIDFNLFIEDIANNHKIYLSSWAFILHFVEPIYLHDKCLNVLSNIVYIIIENFSQLLELLSTYWFHNYFRIFSIINKTSTFAYNQTTSTFRSLIGKGGEITHQ